MLIDRAWIRRAVSAILLIEGPYVLGLTILMAMIGRSAERFEGNEPNRVTPALIGGVGAALAAVLVIAAVVIWRDTARREGHLFARAAVLTAATFHALVALAAVLGLVALALGQTGTGSVLTAAACRGVTAVVGLAIALALTAVARPPQHAAAAP